MIKTVKIITFIAALLLLLLSIFYINPEEEMARARTAYKLHDFDQSMRFARRAKVFLSAKDKTFAYLLISRSAVKMKRADVALYYLDEALKTNPKNSAVLLFKGDTELRAGYLKQAAADISKGLEFGGDSLADKHKAYYMARRGIAYALDQDTAAAEQNMIKAFAFYPLLPEAFELKSYVLENKSEVSGALKALEKAHKLYLERNSLYFMSDDGRKLSERFIDLRVKNFQGRKN
jgi:tetratricopeptide (TPR) repeat protein